MQMMKVFFVNVKKTQGTKEGRVVKKEELLREKWIRHAEERG